jgi:simple sugar transport system permease protein
VLFRSFLTGIAGASFSLFTKAGWGRPQGCEGTGWIALALVIFGGWSVFRVAFGCYFFSFLQIFGLYMQQHFENIPSQVFQVAPFPLMIFSLVIIHFSNKFFIKKKSLEEKKQDVIFSFFRKISKSPPAHLGKDFHP